MTLGQVRAIAAHEIRSAMQGKMVPAFTMIFVSLTIGITIAGLSASGQVLVQGFTRTAVSLLTVAVYLLPLVGLIVGAMAFASEDGGTELLLAQPVSRSLALFSRVAGLSVCMLVISAAGFGAAGIVILVGAGSDGFWGYFVLASAATVLALAALHVGVLVGVMVRRRTTAVGWALALWFCAAVLYDLVSIMLLQMTGSGNPEPSLIAILALNPLDGVRVIALLQLGADVLLGPAGVALQRLMRDSSWLVMWGSLLFWSVAPLAVAGRVYARRDF